jgi:hypothetical protein
MRLCVEHVCQTLATHSTKRRAQQNVVESIFLSIGLGLLSVLVCTLVLSGNWIMACMSMATTCLVGIMVLGSFSLTSWSFGLYETITIALMIPLAIDKVALFGSAYSSAPGDTALDKVAAALGSVGYPLVFCKAGMAVWSVNAPHTHSLHHQRL